ncbi:MAG: flagellar hook-associated protein FlgK [Planctomycetes bacterium]|nr:flagellar hook-associated protein FlgK [Planctomycetota bacterium]
MGLTSSLGIGQSALAAYQAALQVAGQNIANVGTPGYTRNSAQLAALAGQTFRAGQIGNGVRVLSINRAISESLQTRLRTATSDRSSAGAERSTLSRLEGILDPLGDANLGSLLSEFFSSISDLQANPDSAATRGIVVNTANRLAQRIQSIRTDLLNQRLDVNKDIQTAVDTADRIATQIADLNTQITISEAGGTGPASALRDQRDQLLGQLSDYFNITTREQPGGAVNVYIGNESLVQYGQSFGLRSEVVSDQTTGLPTVRVLLKLNNGVISTSSGMVEGLITSRDTHNQLQFDRLNQLAGALIGEFNKIHSGGQGLAAFTTITGTNGVTDSTLPLNTANNGLTYLAQSGSFFINVRDRNTGEVISTRQINIDLDGIGADTTLDSLAADINANLPNVTATVLASGKLQLSSADGYSFTFLDDSSGALASLGLNTFFTGTGALDIGVNSLISGNVNYLAAGRPTDNPAFFTGDNSNAIKLAALQDLSIASLGGVSLNEFYTSSMAQLAVSSSAAAGAETASSVIFDSLTAQRESISGVNLDEEAVNLIQYQRAYEGAAKYMQIVDEMLQTLLGLLR